MIAYTYIVKMSDEYDESQALYDIYKNKIESYIHHRVQRPLQNKMGQS